MEKRILEKDIILPALIIISENIAISTGYLADKLERLYQPTGSDADILKNRNDMKIRQIVRNLVSHRTLEKKGLATYYGGILVITAEGKNYVARNLRSLRGVA